MPGEEDKGRGTEKRKAGEITQATTTTTHTAVVSEAKPSPAKKERPAPEYLPPLKSLLQENKIEKFLEKVAEVSQQAEFAIEDLLQLMQQQYTTVTTTDPHPIHVMTIHKAKGLEFDAVIVPRLDARPRQVNSELLLWADWPIENTTQLLLAPLKSSEEESSPLYDFIQRLQHKKQMHELSRLLYVACTRAKSELYLTASVKTDAEGALKKPHPSSLLKIAGDVMTSPIKTAAPSVITENMSFTHRL